MMPPTFRNVWIREQRADVAHGVGGNARRPTLSVRSTPNSDRKRKGLAPVARCQTRTLAGLFDHLVGADQQRRRDGEA